MKNLGTMDRLLRVILAELCILVAFFWASEEWQIPLYLIAGVMLIQAARGSCGFYSLLGWNSCELIKRKEKNSKTIFVATVLVLAVVGGYASSVLTKNIFLEDLEDVSEAYSLVLQSSGEGNRENATEEFGELESTFVDFRQKYSKYRPLTIKFDGNYTAQMNNISEAISSSKEEIYQGNLSLGHQELKKAEPTIQKMLER
jgi:hypothetical protein